MRELLAYVAFTFPLLGDPVQFPSGLMSTPYRASEGETSMDYTLLTPIMRAFADPPAIPGLYPTQKGALWESYPSRGFGSPAIIWSNFASHAWCFSGGAISTCFRFDAHWSLPMRRSAVMCCHAFTIHSSRSRRLRYPGILANRFARSTSRIGPPCSRTMYIKLSWIGWSRPMFRRLASSSARRRCSMTRSCQQRCGSMKIMGERRLGSSKVIRCASFDTRPLRFSG